MPFTDLLPVFVRRVYVSEPLCCKLEYLQSQPGNSQVNQEKEKGKILILQIFPEFNHVSLAESLLS